MTNRRGRRHSPTRASMRAKPPDPYQPSTAVPVETVSGWVTELVPKETRREKRIRFYEDYTAKRKEVEVSTIGERVTPAALDKLHNLIVPKEFADLVNYVDSLKDRIVELETKAELHDARYDHLKAQMNDIGLHLREVVRAPKVDRLAQAREDILVMFRGLPPRWRMSASNVTQNMAIDEEEATIYQRQVRALAKQGLLIEHREGVGPVHFSLSVDKHPVYDGKDADEC